jgi:hypothetical protein
MRITTVKSDIAAISQHPQGGPMIAGTGAEPGGASIRRRPRPHRVFRSPVIP